MSIDFSDPFGVGCNKGVGLLVCGHSSLGRFDREVDDVGDYENSFALLFVVRSLEETHDFSGFAEVRVAEHLG
jgi:hypothetical protein